MINEAYDMAERFGKSFVRIESNNNIMKRIVTVAAIALFFLGVGVTAHAQSVYFPDLG